MVLRGLAGLVFAAIASAGCGLIEIGMIQTGQFPEPGLYDKSFEWTRQAGARINTLHDFETARRLSYAGLGQLEGLHYLTPDNDDGLFLLNRAWAGVAFAFIDDDRELALERKDDSLAAYHTARARAACKRARFYGEALVARRAEGFVRAQKNSATLRAWLKENYDEPALAEELVWLGFSIVGTVSYDRENAEAIAELWVGVDILEHVVRLDERVENGLAHTVLGSYHARSALAELDEAKKHFDRALEIDAGKVLTTQLTLAQTYHCMKRDKTSYMRTLRAIVEAGDPLPSQRLTNVIAQRRALRYLANPKWQEDCAFDI